MATRNASERETEEKARSDVTGEDAVWERRRRPTGSRKSGVGGRGVQRKREKRNTAPVVAEKERVVEEEAVAGIQSVVRRGNDGELRSRCGGLNHVHRHHAVFPVHTEEARRGVPGDGDGSAGERSGQYWRVKLADIVESDRVVERSHAEKST